MTADWKCNRVTFVVSTAWKCDIYHLLCSTYPSNFFLTGLLILYRLYKIVAQQSLPLFVILKGVAIDIFYRSVSGFLFGFLFFCVFYYYFFFMSFSWGLVGGWAIFFWPSTSLWGFCSLTCIHSIMIHFSHSQSVSVVIQVSVFSGNKIFDSTLSHFCQWVCIHSLTCTCAAVEQARSCQTVVVVRLMLNIGLNEERFCRGPRSKELGKVGDCTQRCAATTRFVCIQIGSDERHLMFH